LTRLESAPAAGRLASIALPLPHLKSADGPPPSGPQQAPRQHPAQRHRRQQPPAPPMPRARRSPLAPPAAARAQLGVLQQRPPALGAGLLHRLFPGREVRRERRIGIVVPVLIFEVRTGLVIA